MLFFDSYALIEIIKGNKNYEKYINETPIITIFNLMEIYYFLLREKNESIAEFYYDFYLPSSISIPNEVIKEAMKLKLKFKNRRLSYLDCVGYVLSRQLNIKFLTGDKEFRNIKGVEFVR